MSLISKLGQLLVKPFVFIDKATRPVIDPLQDAARPLSMALLHGIVWLFRAITLPFRVVIER